VTDRALENVLNHARALVSADGHPERSDQELLRQFLDSSDEGAFAALVARHGPMVLGVCRRVLRHGQDAEDACQATFLVLARQAASVRNRTSLGSFLHSVAYRLSRRLAGADARRRHREAHCRPLSPVAPDAEANWREVQSILDEELERLPEKYRAALVLCYLEGMTRDEAANRLRLPLSTLRGRLEQGRNLLRARLSRRGITLSAALLGPALAEAAVPAALVVVTVRSLFVAGAAVAPMTSSRAVALAEEMVKTMTLNRIKRVAAVLLLGAALTVGTGVLLGAAMPARPIVARMKPAQRAEKTPAETVAVTCDEIARAFAENDALVDEKFAGKRVRVAGGMAHIRRAGPTDQPRYVLTMKTFFASKGSGVVLMRGVDGSNVLLRFEFDARHRKQLAALKSGAMVEVEGQCETKTGVEEGKSGKTVIRFRDCKLVKLKTDEKPQKE
jgi:RNA polymerase sigma factor (sigma-70 family)